MTPTREQNYNSALSQQRKAAHPHHTRLASANAGSGKTRVLVDRVSRLLLRNVAPQDILCLTYTKAAAAEMQARLFKKLGQWSVMNDTDLKTQLGDSFGQPFEAITPSVTLSLARQLFAEALETPEGLKVQTIHAFCERILSRFPIEAGVMPGFEPLDDDQQRELRAEIREQILILAASDDDPELTAALAKLSVARADKTLDELFNWVVGSPEKIKRWAATGQSDLASRLKLPEDETQRAVAEKLWQSLDQRDLKAIADALSQSSSTDAKRAVAIEAALEASDAMDAVQALSTMFFTKAGSPTKSFYTKGIAEPIKTSIDQIAVHVIQAEQDRRGTVMLEMSRDILTVATRFSTLYASRKHDLRALDFSDQILLVRDLLSDAAVADWVRYKLDGGIEHILVDEAQDTSPEQWQIIDALAAPFFQDDPDRKPSNPRTLFAVGDEKQSIYSFQGADPQRFLDQIQYYAGLSDLGEVRMRMSFRSTQQVLDMVDHVLIEGGALREMFDTDYPPASDIARHIAFREDSGCVELWPIVPKLEDVKEKAPWDTTPVDALGERHQRVRLAQQIARTIRAWIDAGEPIFDRDLGRTRPVHAGDVLILVQRRNAFFDAIIQQLKKHDVPVAGADRLTLKDAIIVKDLLSLCRFVLLPLDDLSLAEVLKSPIFGFDDDALFEVAVDREGALWEAVKSRRPDIAEALEQMIADSLSLPPFDFLTATLERMDGTGRSLRERFFKRLGMEAREALDAFLARALDHQYRRAPNLQYFVRDFSSNDVQIKRDLDLATGQARVMTVHGAKGLEAPIVFLPDTTAVPVAKDRLIPVGAGYAWAPPKSERPEGLQDAFEAHALKTSQEQLRLLYVAMTRAETRLIICGSQHGRTENGYQDGSWYDRVKSAFEQVATTVDTLPTTDNETIEILRFGELPSALDKTSTLAASDTFDAPHWMRELRAPEHLPPGSAHRT
ncbi:double-strand break repair helicase AddA [Litorimonas sp. RW-G-Af-16]|uniref:double-strand break repair helicase AddA n=1 Tax=Litorimonas sp. RW-G-Af-16 TaxID=3241168 RepID=UPI003AAFF758